VYVELTFLSNWLNFFQNWPNFFDLLVEKQFRDLATLQRTPGRAQFISALDAAAPAAAS
jgi:hypothetical protein